MLQYILKKLAINETKIAFIGTYLKEKILNTGYDNDSNPESSYMKCFFTYGSDGQEKKEALCALHNAKLDFFNK